MTQCAREVECKGNDDITVKFIAPPSINLPESLFCVVHPGRSKKCKSEGCNRCSQVCYIVYTFINVCYNLFCFIIM